jgi:nucleolar protein 56
MTTGEGWFSGLGPEDRDEAVARIRSGSAETPDEWPTIAVEGGFASDTDEYYELLRNASIEAARAETIEREQADDKQLMHAVRALDDCRSTANELSERVAEWAGTIRPDAGAGVSYARDLAAEEPDGPAARRLIELARRVRDLDDEATELQQFVEQSAPEVAPNLSNLAGPTLAARLIALAGGLDSLAKQPSSTVQVLGAEDALFAHLRGNAPSPKHGIIYTHEYVSGTPAANRGSAARALAGKLTIAARIDHYAGDLRPELEAELDDRIETIRARTGGDD